MRAASELPRVVYQERAVLKGEHKMRLQAVSGLVCVLRVWRGRTAAAAVHKTRDGSCHVMAAWVRWLRGCVGCVGAERGGYTGCGEGVMHAWVSEGGGGGRRAWCCRISGCVGCSVGRATHLTMRRMTGWSSTHKTFTTPRPLGLVPRENTWRTR